jgi:hypothetical protein
LQAAYTWSRAAFAAPYGINAYPWLVYAYGENPTYRPQRLVVNYVWNIPLGHRDGMLGKVTQGWTLAGVTTVQDGPALNITNSGAGTIFCGGPCSAFSPLGEYAPGEGPSNLVASGSLTQRVINGLQNAAAGKVIASTQGYFNAGVVSTTVPTAASVGIPVPAGTTATAFGNIGLGAVLGPGQNNWDMSLIKTTPVFREGQSVEFRAEFFNVWNHPQFQFNSPSINSSVAQTFGEITATSVSPRIVQLALKYTF